MSSREWTPTELNALYLDNRGKAGKGDSRNIWANGWKNPNKAERIAVFHGVATAQQRKDRQMEKLGVQGSHFLPIGACLKKLGLTSSLSSLAYQILGNIRDPKVLRALPGDDKSKVIWRLLCARKGEYPPVGVKDALVEALLVTAYQLDNRFDPEAVDATLSSPDLGSPGAAMEVLQEVIGGLTGVPLDSFFHSSLPIESVTTSDRHEAVQADIEEVLARSGAKHRLQIVVSRGHEGKSIVLRGLLNTWTGGIRDPKCRYRVDGLGLPIFAISCRGLTYLELATLVRLYLVHRQVNEEQITKAANAVKMPIGQTLHDIEREATTGAIWVFSDVNVFELWSVGRSLNENGIRRLVEVLLAGNKRTRIILSSSARPSETSYRFHKSLGSPTVHELLAPQVSELLEFVPKRLEAETKSLIAGNDNPDRREVYANCRVPGHLLQSCAAVMSVIGRSDARLIELLLEHAGDSHDAPPRTDVDEGPLFVRLWELLESFAPAAVYRALCLLVASDDGYVIESLVSAITSWFELEKSSETVTAKHLTEKLRDIISATHERLLHSPNSSRLSPLELHPSEHRALEANEVLPNFQVDPPMQRRLIDALRTHNPVHFRHANMLTAQLARSRAREVKFQSDELYGSRLPDLKRDIQALSCLLASQVDPKEIVAHLHKLAEKRGEAGPQAESGSGSPQDAAGNAQDPDEALLAQESKDPLLRISGRHIFSLAPGASRESVLRYAYSFVLKSEIDRDHRLTMQFDDDALRLELLLMFFEGVGKRYWGTSRHVIPAVTIPRHLRDAFTAEEIVELLVAIALSAHYCNRPDLTSWAFSRFTEISLELSADARASAKVRLECICADNVMLGSAPPGGDRKLQLRELQEHLAGTVLPVEPGGEGAAAKFKASVRVRQRLLRVCVMRGEMEEARVQFNAIFAELRKLVMKGGMPEVDSLSGKANIAVMRTLFGDPSFGGTPVWQAMGLDIEQTKSLFDDLIVGSASRLARFGGVERANIVVCQACREALAGNYPDALAYWRMAYDGLKQPEVSPSFRAGILWAGGQILHQSALLEASRDVARKQFVECYNKANQLRDLAERCEFIDYQVKAWFLMASVVLDAARKGIRLPQAPQKANACLEALDDILERDREVGFAGARDLARKFRSLLNNPATRKLHQRARPARPSRMAQRRTSQKDKKAP